MTAFLTYKRLIKLVLFVTAFMLLNTHKLKAQQGEKDETEQIAKIDTVATFDPETKKEAKIIVKDELTVHTNPDFMPVFYPCKGERPENRNKCTEEKLAEFIAKNTIYPLELKESKKEGTVKVRFVITDTGIVTLVKVIQSSDPLMDEEAMKVIDFLNISFEDAAFFPGKLNGEPVNVKMILPVKFKYQE
ncbi:MAG TPA: energy transducer TonB [Saprospiraceae bacterium]|nr:energy transducer TonB [Saprospiraceae bacterium]